MNTKGTFKDVGVLSRHYKLVLLRRIWLMLFCGWFMGIFFVFQMNLKDNPAESFVRILPDGRSASSCLEVGVRSGSSCLEVGGWSASSCLEVGGRSASSCLEVGGRSASSCLEVGGRSASSWLEVGVLFV
jgi:hypothetical protein